ncbi:SRPBCC family protein [Leucobacter sp. NPDC077196]|uniref:SRPBCC family protein n=1 Tax=Leucobacter sp. NPDC077196 TaxID=3154959 RepID=UPI003422E647
MPITSVATDTDAYTLTVVADFTVPLRRLWDAYADPRQIERFWGPPEYPSTFTRHDAVVGGVSTYVMIGPDGERSGGYWEWEAVDAPHSFVVRDGFTNEDGTPNTDFPSVRMEFAFAETALGSRLTTTSHFGSLEALEQLKAMGMEEGMRAAMAQIDAVVEDLQAFAAGRATEVQLLGDTQARVSRIIRGSVEQVWQAHVDPSLLGRWQLGPDGWSMPVCEYGAEVGQQLRTEWQNDESGERFGFAGVVVEAAPPRRLVTTERMISPQNPDGAGSPETLNEMTPTPVDGGTLLAYVITYPDAEVREAVLATGMAEGMETGYQRLEQVVLAG